MGWWLVAVWLWDLSTKRAQSSLPSWDAGDATVESELGVTPWLQRFLPLPTHLPAVLHHVQPPPRLPALDIPMHLVMNLGGWSNPPCSLAMRDLTQPWLHCQAQSCGNVPLAVPLPTPSAPGPSLPWWLVPTGLCDCGPWWCTCSCGPSIPVTVVHPSPCWWSMCLCDPGPYVPGMLGLVSLFL